MNIEFLLFLGNRWAFPSELLQYNPRSGNVYNMNLGNKSEAFLVAFLLIHVTQVSAFKEVQRFLADNGHRQVDIIYNSSSTKWLRFRPKNVSFAAIHVTKLEKIHDNSFALFIHDSRTDDLEMYLKIIVGRRTKMSLLLFTNPRQDENYHEVLTYLEEMKAPCLFYVASPSVSLGGVHWHQITSLASGSILDALTFTKGSLTIMESYNLKGLQVTSTSLPWVPYHAIDDCNEFGLECETEHGYLKDYMDMLSSKYNFTLLSHKNVDDDWGLIPKDNGTWGGVVGDIAAKKFDMTMSVWTWNSDRDSFADFVPIVKNRGVLAMQSIGFRTDFGLLTRPFTDNSWVTIFFMTMILSAYIWLVKSYTPNNYARSTNYMMFNLLLFFVMIRAYYGGTLTKFFTVTVPEPFESMRDVIKAYPNYNLLIRKGLEGHIYYKMKRGDVVFKEFWDRLMENPEDMTFSSEQEGLDMISANEQNVLAFSEIMLLSHLKWNVNQPAPYMFAHMGWGYPCLMLQKNSPLTPIFTQGVLNFRESGIEHQLRLKWIGVGLQGGNSIEKKIWLEFRLEKRLEIPF